MPSTKPKSQHRRKDHVDEELAAGLATLLPFLTHLHILPEFADVSHIDVHALNTLATKWNVEIKDPKSGHIMTFSELIKHLSETAKRIAVKRQKEKAADKAKREIRWHAYQEAHGAVEDEAQTRPMSSMFEDNEEIDPIKALADDDMDFEFSHISVKFPRNYFGLPTHALHVRFPTFFLRTCKTQSRIFTANTSCLMYIHHHSAQVKL